MGLLILTVVLVAWCAWQTARSPELRAWWAERDERRRVAARAAAWDTRREARRG